MATVTTFEVNCDPHTVSMTQTTDGVAHTVSLLRNQIEIVAHPAQDTLEVKGFKSNPDLWGTKDAFVLNASNTVPNCSSFSGTDPNTVPAESCGTAVSQELADLWACVSFCVNSCCGTFS